jgi:hypothetical protein
MADTALVRIPSWVSVDKLKCAVNGRVYGVRQAGNFVVFHGLKAEDVLTLEFPLLDRTATYTVGDTKYTVRFRGSTVVDISPRATDDEENKDKYPLFVRSQFHATKAPMHRVRRFVAQKLPTMN